MQEKKDKVMMRIEDLLKSHPQGFTIADISKRLSIARNTVLTRLHRLVGEGKVSVRQINMAKLHIWNRDAHPPETPPEGPEHVKIAPIHKEHVKKKRAHGT